MLGFRRGQLHSFVTVVEEGQITRAAKKLHIAQPALSQAIAQLERELGIQLFERHARGVSLTPAGEVFFEKARVSVSATEQALDAVRTMSRAAEAVLDVGFLATSPTVHFPELFAAFRGSYPQTTLSFHELPFPSGAIETWIKDVDVALCFPPKLQPTVDALVLRKEPRFLLTQAGHPLAQHSTLTVADVLGETFLGYEPAQEPGWAGLWSLDDHRGRPPDSVTTDRLATPMELIAAISLGDAVTALPACHAETIVRAATGLVAIPLRDAHPLKFSLIWLKGHHSPGVLALCAIARGLVEAQSASSTDQDAR